jgi:hypothetical protein
MFCALDVDVVVAALAVCDAGIAAIAISIIAAITGTEYCLFIIKYFWLINKTGRDDYHI